jgi:single-strand DNA-binding protein
MFLRIIAVGNLGRDPKMRYTPNGQAVTSFPVAVNRRWSTKDGGQGEEVTWLRVSAWGKSAKSCKKHLAKGSLVLVEGRLSPDKSGGPRTWTRQDGSAAASFEVVADTVRFIGAKHAEGQQPSSADAEHGDAEAQDEIPF